jgi:hypothetical protein
MRAIFISYRREDAEGQAGRLFDDLVQRFGEQAVFMDVAGIEPGRDFRKAIDAHVASCGVLLAMIGKNWTDARNEAGNRRLDDPLDFVRLETASALKRDIPVVPVLVHGAQMPRADQLPADLADLAFRNAIELTHARWDSDVSVLVKALSRYVTPPEAGAGDRGAIERGTQDPAPQARKKRPLVLAILVAAAVVAIAVSAYLFNRRDHDSAQSAVVQQATLPSQVTETSATRPPVTVPVATPRDEPPKEPTSTSTDRHAEVSPELRRDGQGRDAVSRRDHRTAAPASTGNETSRLRSRWRVATFPEPNAGVLAFTIMPDGNPACASYDQAGCLWGVAVADLDLRKLKPLVCGEMHRSVWGATGYEDPKHWCSLAKIVATAE